MALKLKPKPKDVQVIANDPGTDTDDIDFRLVSIDDVESNDYNPNDMEAEFFELLVQQVKEEGMNQPVLVRVNPDKPGKFLIVDGEHRWKAARIAGKKRLGVIVVPFDEKRAKVRT